ncbi:MAG: S-layer homology domain-containing protein [Paenibacillaceae bacterium]
MIRNQKLKFGSLSRKMVVVLSVILLFSQVLVGAAMAENHTTPTSANSSSVMEAIDGAATQLASLDNLSDWAVLGLAKTGHTIPDSYVISAKSAIREWSNGGFTKVTDLERFAIALAAIGYDPQNFEGLNPIGGIFDHPNMMKQGINGSIYALLVLNSGSYNLPTSNQWNKENLLDAVLKQQNMDGGWSLVAGGKSTVDITAMALTALSGFTSVDGVQSSVNKGVQWLTIAQLANGGFIDSGDNSESVAQVIIALSALKIDSTTFVKSGKDALSHLMSFRQADGGFAHMQGLETNGMATEQALLALVAYNSYSKSESFTLYQAVQLQSTVDIRIEGPAGVIADGSVSGKTALDALMNFSKTEGIQLGIKDTSYGKYVNAIGDITEGIYDGNGEWNFNVYRDGSWQFPAVGVAEYELKQGDVMVVYYTDFSTQMVDEVVVEPAKPLEGQAFTVQVKQSTWNWDNNVAMVTPAAGARVQVGARSAITDELGVAHFADGSSAGTFDLVVTGYNVASAPTVVRNSESLTVSSKKVAATYAVEGLDHTVAIGNVKAENALEGLEQLLTAKDVQYVVKELSFGKYVSEIDHVSEGTFGGYDGWGFVVKRDGKWINPSVGIGAFPLEVGDHVVVRYASDDTAPIQSIDLQPVMPKKNEPFSILIKKITWDWMNDNKELILPAVGVEVEAGGLKATTDSSGKAVFSEGLPIGKHMITVTGYRENNGPSVAKATSEMYILDDQQQVSAWAASDVQKVMMYGFMYGVSTKSVIFDAQRSITRAEYVALLLRLIGEQPLVNVKSGYNDVPTSIWYEGSVAKARQLGIVDKTVVNFQPDNAITREELAVMTSKALQFSTGNPVAKFSDLGVAKTTSIPDITAVADNGILYGNDGKFMPLAPVTREMAAAVAVRIYEK